MLVSRRTILGALALAGCRKSQPASKTPRVVSISPSATETLYALGAGGMMVGRSRFCDFPKEAQALPSIGGFADPSLEAILALRPTLVVGTRGPAGPALVEALAQHDVEALFPPTESVEQIKSMFRVVGTALDRDTAATELCDRLDRSLAEVSTKFADQPKVRAIMLFDFEPIIAAGPNGFPDELLTLAGGENLVTGGGPYPQLNMERLLALDPAIIIDASGHDRASARLQRIRNQPGFASLTAANGDGLCALSSDTALRPGPRIVEGVAEIANLLHGKGCGETP